MINPRAHPKGLSFIILDPLFRRINMFNVPWTTLPSLQMVVKV